MTRRRKGDLFNSHELIGFEAARASAVFASVVIVPNTAGDVLESADSPPKSRDSSHPGRPKPVSQERPWLCEVKTAYSNKRSSSKSFVNLGIQVTRCLT